MIDLTEQQIARARANDLDAITAVIHATERRVYQHARRHAYRKGTLDASLAEELRQVGRIAVWKALESFRGRTVAEFFVYMDRSVSGTISNARIQEIRQGVSRSAAADFEAALSRAGGNPYKAERLAADPGVMGPRTLSPEMAYAARLAWEGPHSLDDAITTNEGSQALVDVLASSYPGPGDPDDLDDLAERRARALHRRVHATLARLNSEQRDVLKGTYGITPMPQYDAGSDLADDLGLPRHRIHDIRRAGKRRFRRLWLKGAHESTGPTAQPAPEEVRRFSADDASAVTESRHTEQEHEPSYRTR